MTDLVLASQLREQYRAAQKAGNLDLMIELIKKIEDAEKRWKP